MRYLKSYQQHNEGLKSGLAAAGLIGSLLVNSPEVKSQGITPNPYNMLDTRNITNPISPYGVTNPNGIYQVKSTNWDDDNYKQDDQPLTKQSASKMDSAEAEAKIRMMISVLSAEREKTPIDDTLSDILGEIKSAALGSGDTVKLNDLFGKLQSHMKSQYNYTIPQQKIQELDEDSIWQLKNGRMSKRQLMMLVGWLGGIFLASCGIPQAWKSHKDKHSDGISWPFLILWALGEIFALAYVSDKLDLPLVMNYGTNIVILAIMLYYKAYPKYPTSKIICSECGWSWDVTNTELEDKYVCHKCGHDNE